MKHTRKRRIPREPAGRDLTLGLGSAQPERREDFRQTTRQHAVMQFRSSRMICDLVDLSETGARISILDGAVPNVSEQMTLTLFDGTSINAYVSWVDKNHVGVEFRDPVLNIEERLEFEDLGREYFGKAVILQKSARRP